MNRRVPTLACVVVMLALGAVSAPTAQSPAAAGTIPRDAAGRPNLQGIWQVHNTAAANLEDHLARHGMPGGRGVVEGGSIPYQPWARQKQRENFAARATADPLVNCYMPGVPRIMYVDFPFQIFQSRNHVAMTFEWSQVFRLVYTNGSPHVAGIEFWMGDSRGRWEGDTLVVDVANHNDKTWLDMSGNFHSEAMKLVERYTMLDADTIQYEVTIDDPKVFTAPWRIRMPLHRRKDMARLLEYQCQAEVEEANGAFPRDEKTWFPADAPATPSPQAPPAQSAPPPPAPAATPGPIRRMPDGRPDLEGMFMADGGGANYGLERRPTVGQMPGGRGVIIDPPDGLMPTLPWTKAEVASRFTPERGYDDPTAHCFVAGIPRSMYVPSPMHILQLPGYIVILHERMSWRVIPLDGRAHLPNHLRLWQGDSIGRWDGDSLVVETTNLNGKTWLNEAGELVTHAQTVVERFTPVSENTISYQATITDPLAYTRPFTIAFPLQRQADELLEVACHEDNQDLKHLKDVKDAAAARTGKP